MDKALLKHRHKIIIRDLNGTKPAFLHVHCPLITSNIGQDMVGRGQKLVVKGVSQDQEGRKSTSGVLQDKYFSPPPHSPIIGGQGPSRSLELSILV